MNSESVFQLEDVCVRNDKGLEAVKHLDLHVSPGEIVGIAGVDGNGQTELAEAIVGLRTAESGIIRFDQTVLNRLSTKQRMLRHVGYVPADRHRFGLVLSMKIFENIIIGFHDQKPFIRGINLNLPVIKQHAESLVEAFDIRAPNVVVPAENLSGGNQQKVILAREFSRDPQFLLVVQPTRGLDVGAIEYIHSQILEMRDRNVAILLISLELEEIFALSDRIAVLYEGRVVKQLDPDDSTEKEVGFYMTGGEEKE